MRLVRLICPMKTTEPFAVTGDVGATVRLSRAAAAWVVVMNNGVYMDEEPEPGPSRAELEQQEADLIAGTLKTVGEDSSQSEEPKRPYGNAPKSAWVRYASQVDENMTEERAEGMTKADLMSRYGERL